MSPLSWEQVCFLNLMANTGTGYSSGSYFFDTFRKIGREKALELIIKSKFK